MGALAAGVLRKRDSRWETGWASDVAMGAGINRCARHRRRALHGFAPGPVTNLTPAQGFVEPRGVARLRLVGERAAERDYLSHQRRRPPRQLARKDTAEAPSN